GGPEGVSNAEKVLRIIPPSPPYKKGPDRGPFFMVDREPWMRSPRSSEQSDALRSNAALGGGPEGVSNAEKVLRIIPP
ncbi:MAG: hypothetical protein P1U64_03055, partial [Alcanivoracaceae bacterium]|nr:hypothetical protein [Alcanivoracaceae bacterium]